MWHYFNLMRTWPRFITALLHFVLFVGAPIELALKVHELIVAKGLPFGVFVMAVPLTYLALLTYGNLTQPIADQSKLAQKEGLLVLDDKVIGSIA